MVGGDRNERRRRRINRRGVVEVWVDVMVDVGIVNWVGWSCDDGGTMNLTCLAGRGLDVG